MDDNKSRSDLSGNLEDEEEIQLTPEEQFSLTKTQFFGTSRNQAELLGLGNDLVLLAICDWNKFEDKIVRDQTL